MLTLLGGAIWRPADAQPTTVYQPPQVQTLLNAICGTRGAVLYRGAAGWACRSPVASGLFLQSQGAGADPAYAAALLPASNLADILNVVTARTNLGLGYFATGTDAAQLTGNLAVARLNGGSGASASTYWRGDGTWHAIAGGGDMLGANNLSDVASAPTAWTNLGGGASGKHADSYFLQAANNLSDLGSASTARGNLGVTATGADTTYNYRANNLSDVANAATARSNLGANDAGNLTAGTVAAARGGAGTVSGALKGNGSGTVSQAACGDLSNAAASCATDATNASNIGSGTLNAARLPASPSFSGTTTVVNVAETYTAPSISSNVLTIDLSAGTVFNVSLNANISTFTISNATASKVSAFTLILTANGTPYTQTWGASVKWPGGSAPTLTSTNAKKDILSFVTNDGGTTWYAFVGGQAY